MVNGKKESSQFMTEQEINIERLRKELKEKEQKLQPKPPQQNIPTNPIQMQIPQPNKSFENKSFESKSFEPMASNATPHLLPPQTNMPSIKTPENVKEILNRIHNVKPTVKAQINSGTETQDESANNDRLLSDSTLSESKKKGRKPAKSNISIL
jgi:hypothetical protein